MRKLKDCLPYSEAIVFFFCSGLLSLEACGGFQGFAYLIAADKAKRALSPSLPAVCELQWNSEQVKQHVTCVADVQKTSFSVVMYFLSVNCEIETSKYFYW